ncbi:MAG: PEP-CTERM sorting domain-containing protein [bacterium]
MLNKALPATLLLLMTVIFVPSRSVALPTDFFFDSGQVTLRAVLDDGANTDILSGGSPASILLGGSFVTFDPDASANGTLLGFSLVPATTINLDLDETVNTLDSVSITNAVLTHDLGTTADLDAFAGFSIATLMSGEVTGVLAGGGSFGPEVLSSVDSAATGTLFVNGSLLELSMGGVNLARFEQVGEEGVVLPDVLIKADFQFFGVVPEPGTALLIGLGLAGLSSGARRSRT